MQYIGGAIGVTTVAIPTHQVGDLIGIFAYRDGNTTAPGPIPSPYSQWAPGSGANTNAAILGYTKATTTGHVSGVWSNATSTIAVVYRADSGYELNPGKTSQNGTAVNTIRYPALTFWRNNGKSWAVAFAGHRSTNTSLGLAPTSMTNRVNSADATDHAVAHDSNGTLLTWNVTNVVANGTASGWRAIVAEVMMTAKQTLTDGVEVSEFAMLKAVSQVVRASELLNSADELTEQFSLTRDSSSAMSPLDDTVLTQGITRSIGSTLLSADAALLIQELNRGLDSELTTIDEARTQVLVARTLLSIIATADELASSVEFGSSGGQLYETVLTSLITAQSAVLSYLSAVRSAEDTIDVVNVALESVATLVARTSTNVTVADEMSQWRSLYRMAEDAATLIDELSSSIQYGGGGPISVTLTSAVELAASVLSIMRSTRVAEDVTIITEGDLYRQFDVSATSGGTVSDESLRYVAAYRLAQSLLAVIDEQISARVAGSVLSSTITTASQALKMLGLVRDSTAEVVDGEVRIARLARDMQETLNIIDELIAAVLGVGQLYTRTLESAATIVDAIIRALSSTVTMEDTTALIDQELHAIALARWASDDVLVFDSLVRTLRSTLYGDSVVSTDDAAVRTLLLARVYESLTVTTDELISNVSIYFASYATRVAVLGLMADKVRLGMSVSGTLGMRSDTTRLGMGA